MTNLILFGVTVLAYFLLWSVYRGEFLSGLKRLWIIALLCLPLDVNGHVFTVLGNAVGEKGVYSVCSLFQKSGGKAASIIGFTPYQEAKESAVVVFGFVGIQRANECGVLVGFAGYQRAMKICAVMVGVPICQKGKDAFLYIGVAGYQSGTESAFTSIGIALYQKVGEKTRAFGTLAPLIADEKIRREE